MKSSSPVVKEYVQSCKIESCLIPVTSQEQHIDLTISSSLINNWLSVKYTHIHFGAIRIFLSLHGRYGLSITARMALLSHTFVQYKHVVIGIVLTTLNARSIILNFSVPIKELNLLNLLKTNYNSMVQNKLLVLLILHLIISWHIDCRTMC